MNLLEYEAKLILKEYNIPTPNGKTIKNSSETVATPVVFKSQVPIGGRGKLGGIKIVESESDIQGILDGLFEREIRGFKPKTILAEEKLSIDKEFYLSILINRQLESIEIVAHTNGGVEVESNDSDSFLKIPLDGRPTNSHGEQLSEYLSLESHSFVLQDLLANLYRAFVENDATLIEINPLILTNSGQLVAGDAKITLDDSASFRHPEWDFESSITSANFVTLDSQGTVATIANGAGLAMATVDAVASGDMKPANFLDIGGGANAESVLQAFQKIQEFPEVKAIIINIFAGITRCDEVAKAIINAKSEIDNLPPLFIRLAGTNYEVAEDLLNEQDIPLLSSLEEAISSARKAIG